MFAKQIKQSVYKRLSDPDNGAPLADRAIQGLYPTGSTFKLITVDGGARVGLITPRPCSSTAARSASGGISFKNAGGAVLRRARRCRARCRSPATSSSTARPDGRPARRRQHPEVGAPARARPARPASTCPARSPGLVPTPALAQPALPQEADRPPVDAGRQHQPRRRPGRPAGRPAADGGRLRAIANGGKSSRRTSGCASRTPRAARCRRSHPAPQRQVDINAAVPRRRSSTACGRRPTPRAARRTPSSRASRSRSRARPAPPSAAARATSPGTSRWPPTRTRGSWSRSRSSAAASAPRRRRPAARQILAASSGSRARTAVGGQRAVRRLTEWDSMSATARRIGTGAPRGLHRAARARIASALDPLLLAGHARR